MKFSAKKIAIQIPEPCQENWNEMSQVEKGRFCSLCQKTVMDFSQMTDNEIVRYFKNHSEQKTCGHFKTSQVNRPIKVPNRLEELYWQVEMKYKEGFLKKTYLFLLSGMLLLVGCENPERELAYRKEKLEIQISLLRNSIIIEDIKQIQTLNAKIARLEEEFKNEDNNYVRIACKFRLDKASTVKGEVALSRFDKVKEIDIDKYEETRQKERREEQMDSVNMFQKELILVKKELSESKKSNSVWTWLMDKLR